MKLSNSNTQISDTKRIKERHTYCDNLQLIDIKNYSIH